MEERNTMIPRRVGSPTKEIDDLKVLVGKPTLHSYKAKKDLKCK